MTNKTLNGIYTTAYYLTAPISHLTISASGYLGGGLQAKGAGSYAVVNNGGITGYDIGVGLEGGGSVTNNTTIASTSTMTGEGVLLSNAGTVTNGAVTDTGARISGGNGVEIYGVGKVINDGTIVGTYGKGLGVGLAIGGVVINGAVGDNGALIEGSTAILALGATTVTNYGTLWSTGTGTAGAGGYLMAGGVVTNGSATDTTALIEAYQYGVVSKTAAVSLTNFGTIHATGTAGVGFEAAGGVVTNGALGDTGALIEGALGAGLIGPGSINNFGTIIGTGSAASSIGAALVDGGAVVNGAATDTTALILGKYATAVLGGVGTVTNYGTIGSLASEAGVAVLYGGLVTNGSATDTVAVIEGGFGVGFTMGVGTVVNFGTIKGDGATNTASIPQGGVDLVMGGTLTNGSAKDTSASITGTAGVYANGAAATVANYGTIKGLVAGAFFDATAQITNGSSADTTAFIGGKYGVLFTSTVGTVINFGTIVGGALIGAGVNLAAGGALTNGGGADTKALIEGGIGVSMGKGTLTNGGVISGNSGPDSVGVVLGSYAVAFNGAAANAAAQISAYVGATLGVNAVLSNFATVTGTSGEAVMMSAATSRLNAEAGSVFVGQVSAGAGLVDVVSGVTTMSGLTTTGTVEGPGTLTLSGGSSDFGAGTSLTVKNIAMSGKASTTVTVDDAALTYAGVWTQTAGTLMVSTGDHITFNGTGDSFAGTLAGAGTVTFNAGSDTLTGTTLETAAISIKSAMTLSGNLANKTTLQVASAAVTVAAGGASLNGSGAVVLGGSSKITGASSGATLTNVNNTISGAGDLGGGEMTLINNAGGVIDGSFAAALTIDTGANAIANAGRIEATGAGGVTIAGAVANTGTLIAAGGDLTVSGAVSGAGTVSISAAATADFTAAFTQNVAFGKGGGTLELAQSQSYGGTVTGFSKTGATTLDLADIAFIDGTTTASFSGNTKAGVLTVTDGTHTARIALTGNYKTTVFTVSNDGNNDTDVVGTTPPGASPPSLQSAHGFIAAAAGLGGAGALALHIAPQTWHGSPPLLSAPRMQVM